MRYQEEQSLRRDGSLRFNVRGSSMGVYVLNGPGKIGNDGRYLR